MMMAATEEAVGVSARRKHPKVLMYSAHDLTVANVLGALGLFDNQCPVYTATVFFELVHGEYNTLSASTLIVFVVFDILIFFIPI